MGGEDLGDYATLTGGVALHNDGSAHSSIRGTPRDVRTINFGIMYQIYGLMIHNCQNFIPNLGLPSDKFIKLFRIFVFVDSVHCPEI
jgi:hypothetical protein